MRSEESVVLVGDVQTRDEVDLVARAQEIRVATPEQRETTAFQVGYQARLDGEFMAAPPEWSFDDRDLWRLGWGEAHRAALPGEILAEIISWEGHEPRPVAQLRLLVLERDDGCPSP